MPQYASELRRQSISQAFGEYLLQWQWQWSCTFTYRSRVLYPTANDLTRRWLRRLHVGEGLQVGGFIVHTYKCSRINRRSQEYRSYYDSNNNQDSDGRLHSHILLYARNSRGKSLLDCSAPHWVERWTGMRQHVGTARIREVTDQAGDTQYFSSQFQGYMSHRRELHILNPDLLRRDSNTDFLVENDNQVRTLTLPQGTLSNYTRV